MTTPYLVTIAPTARRQIKTLPQKRQRLIVKFIEALAINPRPPGARKVDGMIGLYSEAIDGRRLVYKIEDQTVLILLVK